VREQIKNFASTKKIFSSGFKLIILDEADMMTQTAQNALRRGNRLSFRDKTRFWYGYTASYANIGD
jgi:DNA polymerase III delta prime subunit